MILSKIRYKKMKEILAIIRMNKMNETKRALADNGISSITARKVMGRGQGKVDYLLLKGAEEGYEEAITQLGSRSENDSQTGINRRCARSKCRESCENDH